MAAIEMVVTDITQPLVENMEAENQFALKLKSDFLLLYMMGEYNQYGLPEYFIKNVEQHKIKLTEDQKLFREFHSVLENNYLHPNESKS